MTEEVQPGEELWVSPRLRRPLHEVPSELHTGLCRLYNLQLLMHQNAIHAVVVIGALFVIISGGIDLSVGSVAALVTGAIPYSTGDIVNVDGGFHLRRFPP